MNEDSYTCKSCGWIGTLPELEYDDVETCFGSDKVEMCPKCSSYGVIVIQGVK